MKYLLALAFLIAPLAFSGEWVHCANQYGKGEPRECQWSDLRTVRYGNGKQWVYENKFDGLAAYKCSERNFPVADFKWSGGPYRCEYSGAPVVKAVKKPRYCATRNDCSGMPDYLQAGAPAKHEPLIKETKNEPERDSVLGAFRTECKFSHFAYDDPLVYPGMPGMSHLHMFFGNDSVDAFSDATGLVDVGGSTCDGGILNRSAYWVPALLDTQKRKPVLPVKSLWYYKGGYQGLAKSNFGNLPKGLGMIGREFVWSCSSSPRNQVGYIPECGEGESLNLAVQFPQCWDGKNLWLKDTAHVVNPVRGVCPVTHPVPIPRITMTMKFAIEYEGQSKHLALSSDMMGAAGSTAHADWVNGWDSETSAKFVENCLNRLNNCHANLLGDGTMLYQ